MSNASQNLPVTPEEEEAWKDLEQKSSQTRLDICHSCDQLLLKTICKACGCIVPMKVTMSFSSCPKGKW